MTFRLRDEQFDCRYFGGDHGILFDTDEEAREQLIAYHSNDNENIEGFSLSDLLDFGMWSIEEVDRKELLEITEHLESKLWDNTDEETNRADCEEWFGVECKGDYNTLKEGYMKDFMSYRYDDSDEELIEKIKDYTQ